MRMVTGAPAYDQNREYLGCMKGSRIVGLLDGNQKKNCADGRTRWLCSRLYGRCPHDYLTVL